MTCVLIDVDGTLIGGPSSERSFIRHLVKRGMIRPPQLCACASFFIRWTPSLRRDVAKKNKAYLTGLDTERIAALAEKFVENELQSRLRPEMLQLLENHHKRGDFIVLLTGTPSFIALPLARKIGAHACVAARCAQHNGHFTAALPCVHPFGEEKLLRAREFCLQNGYILSDCIAYADSRHDLPLLHAVARPVAVYPDPALKRIASREGWEVIGPRHGQLRDAMLPR